uniref:Mov34/MPN/PAD-1 family protein n=1 Tax=Arundo donax TaxID=35708 RepID=A0A0A9CC73_ARUDO
MRWSTAIGRAHASMLMTPLAGCGGPMACVRRAPLVLRRRARGDAGVREEWQ